MLKYCIVGTQRSGSNFICNSLTRTGLMGQPREYFNPVHLSADMQSTYTGNTFEFSRIITERFAIDGVFGFKLHYPQFYSQFVQKQFDLIDCFPDLKIIFLRRKNKLLQAISLAKAYQTNQWTAEMLSDKDPLYAYKETLLCLYDMIIHEVMWYDYLSNSDTPFLDIEYETILNDAPKLFSQIFAFVGRRRLVEGYVESDMKRQKDALTDTWKHRFLDDFMAHTRGNIDNIHKSWAERCAHWGCDLEIAILKHYVESEFNRG